MKTLLAILMTALALSSSAAAAELFGAVDAISGHATVADQGGQPGGLSPGQKVYAGQTITTGPDSEVQLVTQDGGILALRPDTTFRVDEYRADGGSADRIFMSLLRGAVRSITGWIGKHDTSAYRLATPTATIGIRGTDHETTVIDAAGGDEPGTYDAVNEGSTVMKTPQGQADVTPGKFAFVPRNRSAAPSLLARQPQFWATRRLKLESRIPQRKEYFRGRLEQMREQRIQRLEPARGSRLEHRGDGRRHAQRAAAQPSPGQNRLHERRFDPAGRERTEGRRPAEPHRAREGRPRRREQ